MLKNYYQNIILYDFLLKFILFLKLISNQNFKITKSKKNNIFLKIKKNSIIGCKITLRKDSMLFFLEKLIIFIIPNLNNNIKFNIKNRKILNFQIKNFLEFIEFKKEFLKIKDISPLNITIHTNLIKNNELFIFLNFLFIIKNKAKITQ